MIRLTTLGALDLRDSSGHPIREVLLQPKRLALLVYLTVEGRRGPVARDQILATFWPESDSTRARNTLSQALHHLRLAIGSEAIESIGAGAVGIAPGKLGCDAIDFDDAAARGENAAALELYRGEFCPNLFVTGVPALEQWLDRERRRLRDRALTAARLEAEHLMAHGNADAAARAAQRALAMRPDDERDVRALLSLLDKTGNPAAAVQAYQHYARHLAEELDTEPAGETQRLVAGIRNRREPTPPSEPLALPSAERGAPVLDQPALRPSRPRRVAVAVSTAAVVALIAIGGAIGFDRSAGSDPAHDETVAVFPFTVRGGASLAYLGEGMVDLLSAKFDGVSGFRAADPRSVIAATHANAGGDVDFAGIARRLGAAHYIRGDVVEVAGRLQINGRLHDVEGGERSVVKATVNGDTSALFQLVDDLTGQMLAAQSGRDTTIARLAAVTTHSLPALKAFLGGERALRAGFDAAAAASFREAATLDTTFALAQYRLAITATWVTVPDAENPTVWSERAARYSTRLTPFVRDLLGAYQDYREGRSDEAEARYRALTAAHPEHTEAWLMLGETWFHYNQFRGRDPAESRQAFERVLTLDPGNAHALIHLARLSAAQGRYAEVASLVSQFHARYADAARTAEMDALLAFTGSDTAAQRAVMRGPGNDDDELASLGVFQAATLYAQNPAMVAELGQRVGRPILHPRMRQVEGRYWTEVSISQGRWGHEAAAEIIQSAVDDDWLLETEALLASDPTVGASRSQIQALRAAVRARRNYPLMAHTVATSPSTPGPEMQSYLAGLLSVRLGDSVAVARALSELAALAGDAGRDTILRGQARDMAHALRAEVFRTAGSAQPALNELGRMVLHFSNSPHRYAHWGIRERLLKAELLQTVGRDADALAAYNSLLAGYDTPFIAPAHLASAAIEERLGHRDLAVFHYERFIRLWNRSDPAFQPAVARARASLQRLQATAALK